MSVASGGKIDRIDNTKTIVSALDPGVEADVSLISYVNLYRRGTVLPISIFTLLER